MSRFDQRPKPIYDTCRKKHLFARGENHPKLNGQFLCPFCMAEQLGAEAEHTHVFSPLQTKQIEEASEVLGKCFGGEAAIVREEGYHYNATFPLPALVMRYAAIQINNRMSQRAQLGEFGGILETIIAGAVSKQL